MSSHWEWEGRVSIQHDKEKPFAPENGEALLFKVGDQVIYTNSEGVEFDLCVTGLYERSGPFDAMYAIGCRYLLSWDCHWFPVRESSLRLIEGPMKPFRAIALLRRIKHGDAVLNPDEEKAIDFAISAIADQVNKGRDEPLRTHHRCAADRSAGARS